jgi:competence protein ComEA
VAWSDIVRLPSALWDARWMPNRRAVIGALLLVVLAIGVFGLRVAWARADGAPRAVQVGAPGATVVPATRAPGGTATSRPTGTATPGDAPGPTTGPSGPALVVHVVGRVRHPGIVTLPPGARVVDAVEAAGGAARGADLSAINLARLVVDGEQIRVPRPGEIVATAPTGAGAMGSAPSGSALVSLNTADAASLDGLPGIGPVLAQRILDWRAENGRFTTVDELGEVSGIGEKLLAQLRPKVTV